MNDVTLCADCAHCDGLCCVALAFDRSNLFAFDKAAGEPCQNLTTCGGCAIHDERAARGFGGCVSYECLGAGQRVTQMFAGRSWRDGPVVAGEMFDAFHAMRVVHELLFLLGEAKKLSLTTGQTDERARLLGLLQRDCESPRALRVFERGPLAGEVRTFLASLRDLAEPLYSGPRKSRRG